MQFREWLLLKEGVVVNTKNGQTTLAKSKENHKMVEFSYSAGDYYSSFEVWPFAENRQGYVQAPSTGFDARASIFSATVIGVIKNTPLEPGNGADRAFIKALTASLQASGRNPLQYREGDSEWMGVLSAAGVKDDEAMKGMKGEKELSDTNTPPMGTASSNARNVGKSMSVSRTSGSWAYFFPIMTGHAEFQVDAVVGLMKKAAQPLVDNDIIDQYRIVKGWNYKAAEVVWSKKGKEEYDDADAKVKRSASYIKFLADRMLANHPDAKSGILKYFRNSWDKDLQPQNTRVPIEDLKSYVQHYHSESPFLSFFLDAVEGDRERMYDVMDDAAKTADQDEAIRRYKEIADEEYDYMVENPRLFMNYALNALSMSEIMEKHASGNFQRFKREYEEAINDWLGSGEPIRPSDIEYLKKLSQYLDIKAKGQIEDAHKDVKSREEEDRKKQEDEKARKKAMIARGNFKYIVLGKNEAWEEIHHKYLDGDEVEVAELAKDEGIIDKESIFHAAHEKASEEATLNAEERKSESYGQDRDEVESDIDDEWDEYIEDRFEEGAWEGTPEEEVKKEIKDQHWDDFVAWKVEILKKEEDDESWRYEPEPEDSDIWKIEAQMSEEQAYEDGLVVIRWPDDSDEIEVDTHSKHFDKAREEARKSLALSMDQRDEDGQALVRRSTRVVFNIVDKGELKRLMASEV